MSDQINKLLSSDEYAQIESMIDKFKKDKHIELEVSFRNINYSNYMRISEHYVNVTPEDKISAIQSLDISIMLPDDNTYRVSLMDSDLIENFTAKFARARIQDIQKYLLSLDLSDQIEIIYKDRGSANRLYVEDISTVFKVTTETPLAESSKPKLNGTERMLYRFKNRYSFESELSRIDITTVREAPDPNLSKKYPTYEIEIEFTNRKITTKNFSEEVLAIMSVVQNSPIPLGKKEAAEVIKAYQQLIGVKPSNSLESRNVISLETIHLTRYVPNKYGITDKADGERHFMFIYMGRTYLITINLVVKKMDLGVDIDKKFDNTILDGELTSDQKIFLAFDVVYANGINYYSNTNYNLTHRIIVLNSIIDKCFNGLIPFPDYANKNTDMDLTKIRAFYAAQLRIYWKTFVSRVKKNESSIFVSRKLYFIPYGIDLSELFMLADLVWKSYVYEKLTPYTLDGIIYSPINSPYQIKVSAEDLDSKPLEYKWKPPKQNSIDFFIKYELDANNNETIFYDNSVVRSGGRPYKICGLYVGIYRGSEERPIPFKVNNVEQKAHLYLVDDEARDVEGNIIYNSTVVEFIFDTSLVDVDSSNKWIPLRTRYDKTESAQRYKKKFGNNLNIASRIWRSIINPITEDNISALANSDTYAKEFERLVKSITLKEKPQSYYQKTTKEGSGMRAFHNWIKSNMILTYGKDKPSVLDIGCGRGGDLIKFINAKVGEYVGVDIDNNGLYVINQSANNRYQNLAKNNKDVPPMYFINADAKGLFNIKSQSSILPNMTDQNQSLIGKYLSGKKKYALINCQFTLHYYLSDELSWNNFRKNINDHLESNGYMLITCFDGKLIYDKLLGKTKLNVSYTDNHGNKNTFFEIRKVYDDAQTNRIGMPIDVYNSLISEKDTYNREFLVFPDFLIQSLKEIGLELVETDSFFNLFHLYKNYFLLDNEIITGISTKKHNEIRNFYLSLFPRNHTDSEPDAVMASFKFSMLNRYYVFKKTTIVDFAEPARVVGINNKINLGKILMPYFETNKMIIDPSKRTTQINKIYHELRTRYRNTKPSVYLVRHSIAENEFEGDIYKRNKFEFSLVKEGIDPKTLLIYKSPDKYFYPIFYQNIDYDVLDDQAINPIKKIKGTYLLDSNKIVGDLDVLVALSEHL